MIRTKGEFGIGDVIEAVRHMRMINFEIRRIKWLSKEGLYNVAKELGALLT